MADAVPPHAARALPRRVRRRPRTASSHPVRFLHGLGARRPSQRGARAVRALAASTGARWSGGAVGGCTPAAAPRARARWCSRPTPTRRGCARRSTPLIAPRRGQMLATAPLARRDRRRGRRYAHWGYQYWRQTPDGRLVIGGWRDLDLDGETGYDDAAPPTPIQAAIEAGLARAGARAARRSSTAGPAPWASRATAARSSAGSTPSTTSRSARGFTGHGMGMARRVHRRTSPSCSRWRARPASRRSTRAASPSCAQARDGIVAMLGAAAGASRTRGRRARARASAADRSFPAPSTRLYCARAMLHRRVPRRRPRPRSARPRCRSRIRMELKTLDEIRHAAAALATGNRDALDRLVWTGVFGAGRAARRRARRGARPGAARPASTPPRSTASTSRAAAARRPRLHRAGDQHPRHGLRHGARAVPRPQGARRRRGDLRDRALRDQLHRPAPGRVHVRGAGGGAARGLDAARCSSRATTSRSTPRSTPPIPRPSSRRCSDLTAEAIAAGFYNIDVDTSTLVDLSKPRPRGAAGAERRRCAPSSPRSSARTSRKGVTVSVGGEIGEVGGKNSTPEELRRVHEGVPRRRWRRLAPGAAGISKISIQTGTSHGGVPLPDGTIAQVQDRLRRARDAARRSRASSTAWRARCSTAPRRCRPSCSTTSRSSARARSTSRPSSRTCSSTTRRSRPTSSATIYEQAAHRGGRRAQAQRHRRAVLLQDAQEGARRCSSASCGACRPTVRAAIGAVARGQVHVPARAARASAARARWPRSTRRSCRARSRALGAAVGGRARAPRT